MSKNKVIESAASGAVGAHSIAVRVDGETPPMKRREGLLSFLTKYHNKQYANSFKMVPVNTHSIAVTEDVSLDQVFSKLRGIENTARRDDNNATTYGVEDDSGNMMKITVNSSQAEDFEVALAQELGELEEYKMTGRGGYGRDISMAEVLFNLKQKFDIIDVEFPEIPTDKVYNADKVSDPEDLQTDDQMGSEEPLDMEGDMGEETPPEEGEESMPSMDGEFDADLDSEEDSTSSEEDDEMDSEMGEEFGETGPEDEESLLKGIIRMLSAEAEARKAQHEAEAEKAREAQARYSARAAENEMRKQEELLSMEEEKKRQQSKEKEARQLADLARFKARGSLGENVSFKDILVMLNEISDLEKPQDILRQRRNLRDVPQNLRSLYQRYLMDKMRIAREKERMGQEQDNDDNDDQNDQRQDRREVPNHNQPVPDRRPIGGSNL